MPKHAHDDTEELVSNEFAQFLATHRRGQAANEAGSSLREAIVAACDTGKKAVLTIKVTVAPKGTDQVEMTVDVAAKIPKAGIMPSMFWVEDGRLHKNDPRQAELPLREVSTRREERSVPNAANG